MARHPQLGPQRRDLLRAGVVTDIPDSWFAGFLQANPTCSIHDAIRHWLDQERLEAQWQAEHA